MTDIVLPSGEQAVVKVPAVQAVHPTGSRVLVEVLKPDEVLNTNLYVAEDAEMDGAPQAYIIELGPTVDEGAGLEVGA